MGKNKSIIFAILTIVALATAGILSCRRVSDNGKIDGYWQIHEIYYLADGTTEYPTDKFMAVQLELVQFGNPNTIWDMTGVLSYDKSEDFFIVDFRNNPSESQLYKFGLSDKEQVIHIDKADRKHLVLSTPIAVLRCRRF